MRVPVTTVPKPETVNERSTAKRGRPKSGRGEVAARILSIWRRRVSSPWPVWAERVMMAASSRTVSLKGFDRLHFG